MTGETAAQTVRRMRLHRAATQLVSTDYSIQEIVRLAGYGSQAAFSRAFADAFDVPPAKFRKEGRHVQLQWTAIKEDNTMAFDIAIETLHERPAFGILHSGPYEEIGTSFDKLFTLLGQNGLMSSMRGVCAAYLDDPTVVAPAMLRSQAAVYVDEPLPQSGELTPMTFGGGSYAVLLYKGPYAAIRPAYDWLFGTWLPGSGRDARNAPSLEIYLNSPMDTEPDDLLTQICLPVVQEHEVSFSCMVRPI